MSFTAIRLTPRGDTEQITLDDYDAMLPLLEDTSGVHPDHHPELGRIEYTPRAGIHVALIYLEGPGTQDLEPNMAAMMLISSLADDNPQVLSFTGDFLLVGVESSPGVAPSMSSPKPFVPRTLTQDEAAVLLTPIRNLTYAMNTHQLWMDNQAETATAPSEDTFEVTATRRDVYRIPASQLDLHEVVADSDGEWDTLEEAAQELLDEGSLDQWYSHSSRCDRLTVETINPS